MNDQVKLSVSSTTYDQVDGNLVLAAPGHDDVGVRHGRRDVIIERGLDMPVVLFEDTLHFTTSLGDVSLEPPTETNVWIRVDKNLHVQEVEDFFVMEGKDALEYENVGS